MESIKRARRATGLSLTEVAERSGLLRQAVIRAEREGTDIRVSTALAIARALDVPICELIDEDASHARHGRKRTPKR